MQLFFRLKTYLFIALSLIMAYTVGAFERHTEIIKRHQWPTYENGGHIIKLPQISQILSRFEEHPGISIEIRYPGEEQGKRWGQSMYNWLVTFGIPGDYISLFPGSGAGDQLTIEIWDRR